MAWASEAQRPVGGQLRNTASLCVLVGHTGPVRTLAATCGRVFSGSYDRTVCVWDVEGLVRIGTLSGHTEVRTLRLYAGLLGSFLWYRPGSVSPGFGQAT